jgi:hypothetical protein
MDSVLETLRRRAEGEEPEHGMGLERREEKSDGILLC